MVPDVPVDDVRTDALHLLSNGVYVLTACEGETVHAATITWVSQVSIEPMLVLAGLRRNSLLTNAVHHAHRFVVNILGVGQEPVAERFFQHLTVPAASPDLSGFPYRISAAHCPLLTDALAWVECRYAGEADCPGDHSLVLGEVTETGVRRTERPLLLGDTPWRYGGFKRHDRP
jgi:flavin reductase (DIM6/NTAB) family NADH-FMN oxidoreductase RutF